MLQGIYSLGLVQRPVIVLCTQIPSSPEYMPPLPVGEYGSLCVSFKTMMATVYLGVVESP